MNDSRNVARRNKAHPGLRSVGEVIREVEASKPSLPEPETIMETQCSVTRKAPTAARVSTLRGVRTGSSPQSRPQLLQRVSALMRIGRYSDAAVAARDILTEDPQNFAVLELLAKALWQGGMMDEVVEVTRRLIVINPYEPGYHSLQAAALQCLGRYGESARAYERAGNEPGAREALADLNKWQACLVSEIMQTDPVFRAQYEQNAAFATAARGFSFCETEEKDDLWIVSGERRESLYTRPS